MPHSRFLVDTSIWLEVLPITSDDAALRERVDDLLAQDAVATTGMVRLELLGGARTSDEWSRLGDLLSALHYIPIDEGHWNEAAYLGYQARRSGITVPYTDLLIGAVALRAKAVLLHRDRHFDLLAGQTSLRVESHVDR
jgi:predicted nucleic acid-binding protein